MTSQFVAEGSDTPCRLASPCFRLIALSPLVTVILVFALLLMFLVPAGIGHMLEKGRIVFQNKCLSSQAN